MRTMLKGMVATALVAGFAMSAQAETKPGMPAPTATTASDGSTVVKDRRYCVESTTTGSRIRRKLCKTRSAWLQDDGFDPLDPK